VECYNPEADSWSAVVEMSARRSGAGKDKLDLKTVRQQHISKTCSLYTNLVVLVA
jgi:hypothetical protein